MKTFKEFLLELKWENTAIDFIANQFPHIPLLPNLIEKIFGKKQVISFHLCGLENFKSLIKIQDTQKSISTFQYISSGILETGIFGTTGIVVGLQGTPLISYVGDLMSKPDEQGIRWLTLDSETSKLASKIENKIFDLKRKITKKIPIYKKDVLITDENIYFEYVKDYLKDKKLKDKIIKLFFTEFEKLIIKNKELFQKFLFDYLKTGKGTRYDDWDEIVLSNFKIKKVFLLKDIIRPKEEVDFKEKNIKWKFPFELISSEKLLSKIYKITGKK